MDERDEALKRDRERQRKREELRQKREEQVTKQKKMAIGIGLLAGILLIVSIFAGVQISKNIKAKKAKEKARQEKLVKEKEQENHTIEFLAVGDNIAHKTIRESGMQEDGVWNYDHVYQYVKKDVEEADLSLVTQETVFVENRNNVSGYPTFGTPPEFGDALVNTGFDVVAHATNHILDKGTKSIEYTLDWWKTNHPDTKILGIHDSQEAADEITVVKCKN